MWGIHYRSALAARNFDVCVCDVRVERGGGSATGTVTTVVTEPESYAESPLPVLLHSNYMDLHGRHES